jgi:hypothetical protein
MRGMDGRNGSLFSYLSLEERVPAQLRFVGHALMENRSGLIVEAELTQADGHAERAAAISMIERHSPASQRRLTLGADKGYDSADFVTELRRMCVAPHVAAKARSWAIDGRTTRHAGYAVANASLSRSRSPSAGAPRSHWEPTLSAVAPACRSRACASRAGAPSGPPRDRAATPS